MNNRGLAKIVGAMLLIATAAVADRGGYSEIFQVHAESGRLIAVHEHDWSVRTDAARWEMISADQDVFSAKNKYSTLLVKDKHTGQILFTSPVPALRHLWISSDSRFIVGLSNIKVWNPIQLVVFDSAGRLLLKRKIDETSFGDVTQTVMNYVRWYQEPVPHISLRSDGGELELSVEGNNGQPRRFKFGPST